MKRFSRLYVLIAGALGLCLPGVAIGNPTGPTVVSGQASISSTGNLLPIINSPGAIINWQSFSIAPNEVQRFIQQSGSSAVINRVNGMDPAKILGTLQSNSPRVLLINQGATVGGGDLAPGKSVELSDPKSPNIKIEVKAPANRAVNVQQLVDSIGTKDVSTLLSNGGGVRSATQVVRDESGRILLKAAP